MILRRLAVISQQKISIMNIRPDVLKYLERMDFFTIAGSWVESNQLPDEQWSRNPHSPNLLELTVISSQEDVTRVVTRAEQIFCPWLKTMDLNRLLTVLSELCANIYQHSGDQYGCAMIQRYEHGLSESVEISLSVGDIGKGIRGSLSTRFPDIGSDPLDFLYEAMQGRSARNTGRGGLGLRQVEEIVRKNTGLLWIRSETAAIASTGSTLHQDETSLAYFPGTQISVRLNAPLLS